jgi:hypothetical protein
MTARTDRRSFIAYFGSLGLTSTLFPVVLWARLQNASTPQITKEMLRDAASVAGLTFSDRQLDEMLEGMNQHRAVYERLRAAHLDNNVAPPLYFNPVVPGAQVDRTKRPFRASKPARVVRPRNLEEAAFWPVTQLAALIRTSQPGPPAADARIRAVDIKGRRLRVAVRLRGLHAEPGGRCAYRRREPRRTAVDRRAARVR